MSKADCVLHANELAHAQNRINDHEARIRELEKATWRMTAYVSLAASIFSALGSILVKYLGG